MEWSQSYYINQYQINMPGNIRDQDVVSIKTDSERDRSHILQYFRRVEYTPKRTADDSVKCQRLN